jgi:hypothetical protein
MTIPSTASCVQQGMGKKLFLCSKAWEKTVSGQQGMDQLRPVLVAQDVVPRAVSTYSTVTRYSTNAAVHEIW